MTALAGSNAAALGCAAQPRAHPRRRANLREVGPDASVAEVAERAGVGTATIFRRFPTKSDLIGAVVEAELKSLLGRVEAAVGGDDPGAALRDFVATAVESYVGDRCLCDTVGGELFERPRIAAVATELFEALDRLVRQAQKSGAIRKDVTAADIGFFVRALGQAGSTSNAPTPARGVVTLRSCWTRCARRNDEFRFAARSYLAMTSRRLQLAQPTLEQLEGSITVRSQPAHGQGPFRPESASSARYGRVACAHRSASWPRCERLARRFPRP